MFALLFLLITLMVQTGVSGYNCPERWFEYGDKWVLYTNLPKNHADAQAECKKMGANLVSVQSAEDYKRLQYLIKSMTNADGQAWLGGVDLTKSGKYTWVDGSKFVFSSWCVGEPNHPGVQNCIRMNYSEKKCWDNFECWAPTPYFCAK